MGKVKPRIHARTTPRASVGRCWILDDVAYFTPHFQPHRMQPVLAAAAGSELYTAVEEHFEYVWTDTLPDDGATLFRSPQGTEISKPRLQVP